MSKNLITEIAKLLGVELGEEFKVKGDDESTYIFTDDGLKVTYDGGIGIAEISSDAAFVALVMGKDEIVKLPWKPREGERYYTFNVNRLDFDNRNALCVTDADWDNLPADVALLRTGWVYRTEKEAKTALPAVAKELGMEYIL